jgi:hypothetical protein
MCPPYSHPFHSWKPFNPPMRNYFAIESAVAIQLN